MNCEALELLGCLQVKAWKDPLPGSKLDIYDLWNEEEFSLLAIHMPLDLLSKIEFKTLIIFILVRTLNCYPN